MEAKPKHKRKRDSAHDESRDDHVVDFVTALTIEQCETRLLNARKPRFLPGHQAIQFDDPGEFTVTHWGLSIPGSRYGRSLEDRYGGHLAFHGWMESEDGKTRIRGRIDRESLKDLRREAKARQQISRSSIVTYGFFATVFIVAFAADFGSITGWLILAAGIGLALSILHDWWRIWRWVNACPGNLTAWIEDLLFTPY